MTVLTFDTHAAANEFESAGFSKAQIEALVNNARRTTTLPDISALATKADLAELKVAVKADIADLKGEMSSIRAEISSAKLQAITIILTAGTVIGGMLVAFSKLIH